MNEKESPLILKDLRISLQTYGEHEGKYLAKVVYTGEKGSMELKLSPELSNDLLRFCGNSIKRFSESAILELSESFEKSFLQAKESDTLEND